jgi:hypothetical protein
MEHHGMYHISLQRNNGASIRGSPKFQNVQSIIMPRAFGTIHQHYILALYTLTYHTYIEAYSPQNEKRHAVRLLTRASLIPCRRNHHAG